MITENIKSVLLLLEIPNSEINDLTIELEKIAGIKCVEYLIKHLDADKVKELDTKLSDLNDNSIETLAKILKSMAFDQEVVNSAVSYGYHQTIIEFTSGYIDKLSQEKRDIIKKKVLSLYPEGIK
jgi:hypothetical protein